MIDLRAAQMNLFAMLFQRRGLRSRSVVTLRIETFEPIEPAWQAIREWIPDDDGPADRDLFGRVTPIFRHALFS